MPEYLASANQNTMVIVQIETPLGLKNVNEIASVEGIGESFFFAVPEKDLYSVTDASSQLLRRHALYRT